MSTKFDCIVVGGTPGGIASAITLARLGRYVALVEYHPHIGGMSTSGLGKSDIENRAMVGGLFTEFTNRVHQYYLKRYGETSKNVQLCQDGYYYEPSVAEIVFDNLVNEQSLITTLKFHRFESTVTDSNSVCGVIVRDRKTGIEHKLSAPILVDATYEGDVFASAGAEYRLGRESREEFGEPHAGVVYYDYIKKTFLPGTTWESDNRLPAYTYRLCLTTNPANSKHLTKPPTDYDQSTYSVYLDDLKTGRLAGPKNPKPGRGYYPDHFNTLVRALSVAKIPNEKTDVNINPRPLAFPFAEENRGYVEGCWETRERICKKIRLLTVGLLWFLQQSPDVPNSHRAIANQYHLPKDEFADTENFPFQLYVREARRLVGLYTLTEHDITRSKDKTGGTRFVDAIATNHYPIDVHPTRKKQLNDTVFLEGFLGMLDDISVPYQIPYRVMIPKQVDGLIVPVAASATHVAFSSIRMEPTWMSLGQAAGVAAHVALKQKLQPRNVPVKEVQNLLRQQGQIIDLP